jgi:hypothetical protein
MLRINAAPKVNEYGHIQASCRAIDYPCGFHGMHVADRQLTPFDTIPSDAT